MSSCLKRYYHTELCHLAYLRFVVESYEGLAQITSLPGRCEVEWTIPWELADQAEALARALASEILLVPIAPPEDWPF